MNLPKGWLVLLKISIKLFKHCQYFNRIWNLYKSEKDLDQDRNNLTRHWPREDLSRNGRAIYPLYIFEPDSNATSVWLDMIWHFVHHTSTSNYISCDMTDSIYDWRLSFIIYRYFASHGIYPWMILQEQLFWSRFI